MPTMPTMPNSMESLPAAAPATVAITTQVPGYYKCGHCALHFKTRSRFRAHEATCLSLKQIRARATFAPDSITTNADLFALVQQLAVRLDTAEHELNVLKQQQRNQEKRNQEKRNQEKRNQQPHNQIHRDNLLEWLNGHKALPTVPFTAWLPAIPPITREHLELVFQHGFMDGMCAIIAAIVSIAAPPPLCAYDEAPSLLIYETETQPETDREATKWRTMTQSEFERFINRMQKLLMNEFVCWQQEHKERWHDPDFAEQYDANLLKVTGSGKGKSGGCSNRDVLMTRMKPKVYAAIKRSANDAMQ